MKAGWLLWGLWLLLAGCRQETVTYPERRLPAEIAADPTSVAAGHRLFLQLCAHCHGRTEEGRNPRADFFQPPAPDFRVGDYARRDPAYLFWRIQTGKTAEPFRARGSVMPAWGGSLSDREIWQLVVYLKQRADG